VYKRQAADTAKAEGKPAPSGSDWLASHPSNDKRLQDIIRVADGYKGKAAYGDDGRLRYLQAIDGMEFGDSRAQGLVRGQNFFHEPLGIAMTAPAAWKIKNTQEAVALVNPAGDAGLVMQTLGDKAGSSHDEIIRNVFKPTQSHTERLTLNGLAATHFTGTVANSQGKAQAIEATLVTGPSNRNYALLYVAKDASALQRSRASLKEAEATFRALTAADRKAAQPWRLKLATYPQGGFAQLAKQSPLPRDAERQLRLVNGVYAGNDPPVGQRVKVIE
jgi:predicted Zn-dependent protease